MTDLEAAKRPMRAEARARRALVDPRLSLAVCEVLLRDAAPPPGAIVAGYCPIGDEVDVMPALTELSARGYTIALPATPALGHPLTFHRWRPGDAMRSERFGTSRPVADDPLTPDYLLVPLLAFDRAGRRLGYGGGYYDRILAALPNADWIGCAYADQEVACVPAGPHDVRMPRVATEHDIILCKEEISS